MKGQEGHRKRLRERFLKGGEKAVPDYELLELLLCGVIPRGDVKPLAKTFVRMRESWGASSSECGKIKVDSWPGRGFHCDD